MIETMKAMAAVTPADLETLHKVATVLRELDSGVPPMTPQENSLSADIAGLRKLIVAKLAAFITSEADRTKLSLEVLRVAAGIKVDDNGAQ